MFDDNKEPQDIFAEVEPTKPSAPIGTPAASMSTTSSSSTIVRTGPPRWLFVILGLAVLGGGIFGVAQFILKDDAEDIKVPPAAENVQEQTESIPTQPIAQEENVIPVEEVNLIDVNTDLGESGDAIPEVVGTPDPSQLPANVPIPVLADSTVDTDKDGLLDADEAVQGTDITNPDTDGDNLNDAEEVNIYFTSPLKPDTDGDGYTDGAEVRTGYNPNGSGRLATKDTDGDGLTDEQELIYATDPLKSDTDGDGFTDGAEVDGGYNPNGPGRLPAI